MNFMLYPICTIILFGIIIIAFEIYFLYQFGKTQRELDAIIEEAKKQIDESDNK